MIVSHRNNISFPDELIRSLTVGIFSFVIYSPFPLKLL